jgi:carbon catabolite-derepressing protein kinase
LALSSGLANEAPETNVFDLQFADGELESEDDSDESEGDLVRSSDFAILDTSLPSYKEVQATSPHHLTAYATAKSQSSSQARSSKDKKPHRTKWHFGIRSRSPPMEVMAEIYRTLKALGMEWKEKKDLGGLGGTPRRERVKIERAPEFDGSEDLRNRVDLKAAAGIYLVESRIRVGDVVVSFLIPITCPY